MSRLWETSAIPNHMNKAKRRRWSLGQIPYKCALRREDRLLDGLSTPTAANTTLIFYILINSTILVGPDLYILTTLGTPYCVRARNCQENSGLFEERYNQKNMADAGGVYAPSVENMAIFKIPSVAPSGAAVIPTGAKNRRAADCPLGS